MRRGELWAMYKSLLVQVVVQLDVLEAIEDLKGFIQRELRILREEIKNLRDEIGAGPRS